MQWRLATHRIDTNRGDRGREQCVAGIVGAHDDLMHDRGIALSHPLGSKAEHGTERDRLMESGLVDGNGHKLLPGVIHTGGDAGGLVRPRLDRFAEQEAEMVGPKWLDCSVRTRL